MMAARAAALAIPGNDGSKPLVVFAGAAVEDEEEVEMPAPKLKGPAFKAKTKKEH
jgi:hypothetical protein